MNGADTARTPPNLLRCDDEPLSMNCEPAVARARKLFHAICPETPFLAPVDEMGDELDEGEREEHVAGGQAAESQDKTDVTEGEVAPAADELP